MRAASEGIELDTLEVLVESESDDRGLLGVAEDVPAGPVRVKVTIRIGSPDVEPERLHEIVDWARRHSPVGDVLERAVPTAIDVRVIQ